MSYLLSHSLCFLNCCNDWHFGAHYFWCYPENPPKINPEVPPSDQLSTDLRLTRCALSTRTASQANPTLLQVRDNLVPRDSLSQQSQASPAAVGLPD
ncbi:hypothetical protein ACLKA7_017252 [Drosophila subpalustris]